MRGLKPRSSLSGTRVLTKYQVAIKKFEKKVVCREVTWWLNTGVWKRRLPFEFQSYYFDSLITLGKLFNLFELHLSARRALLSYLQHVIMWREGTLVNRDINSSLFLLSLLKTIKITNTLPCYGKKKKNSVTSNRFWMSKEICKDYFLSTTNIFFPGE